MTDQEKRSLLPTIQLKGSKPVAQVWLTKADALEYADRIESAATAPLLERIAELEAERDQIRTLFYKAKDEYHAARQESALRWQLVCDLTDQRDMLAAAPQPVAQPSEVEKLMDAAGLCRRCAATKEQE